MPLLERVSTLLRANLNDLIDKAEDPARLVKQLVLDMENQLLQLKTQVAIAMADQHVLEAKQKEHAEATAAWRQKAELALNRNDEALARAALERSLQSEQLLQGYTRQCDEQRGETDVLREQYQQLLAKLSDTSAQAELLLHQHRRARKTPPTAAAPNTQRAFSKLRNVTQSLQAANDAERRLQADAASSVNDRLAALQREERIESLLQELREKPRLLKS